jgi:hypothetical protein
MVNWILHVGPHDVPDLVLLESHSLVGRGFLLLRGVCVPGCDRSRLMGSAREDGDDEQ